VKRGEYNTVMGDEGPIPRRSNDHIKGGKMYGEVLASLITLKNIKRETCDRNALIASTRFSFAKWSTKTRRRVVVLNNRFTFRYFRIHQFNFAAQHRGAHCSARLSEQAVVTDI